MPLRVPSNGLEQELIRWIANLPAPLTIRLYINDITPGFATVLTDFTWADFNDSMAQTVATWSAPVADDPYWRTQANANEWTVLSASNLPQTVYGYVVYNAANGAIEIAERFTNPILLDTVDTIIRINARMSCKSVYPLIP